MHDGLHFVLVFFWFLNQLISRDSTQYKIGRKSHHMLPSTQVNQRFPSSFPRSARPLSNNKLNVLTILTGSHLPHQTVYNQVVAFPLVLVPAVSGRFLPKDVHARYFGQLACRVSWSPSQRIMPISGYYLTQLGLRGAYSRYNP
ncbi:hypothetical protein EDB85DRAFT_1328609 [Lactarius pseudohatsudake]|nr:hypothetical protein EDB85DRAFT_1328609 [Lactarius pseudohatsudake]